MKVGERTEAINVLIDSGYTGFICLSYNTFQQLGLNRIRDPKIIPHFEDMTGRVYIGRGVELIVEFPPLNYKQSGLISTSEGVNVNVLGMQFLERFILTFNGNKNELTLQLV